MIKAYTDGSAYYKDKSGGWSAIIIIDGLEEIELSGNESNTTNNRQELYGVLKVLEYVDKLSEITIYSDSQYVVNGIGDWKNGLPITGKEGWVVEWKYLNWVKKRKEIKNRDLFEKIYSLVIKHKLVNMVWIRGHAGNLLNEKCDKLASKSRKDGIK